MPSELLSLRGSPITSTAKQADRPENREVQKDEETKSIRRADNSSIVYGELWSVLHELDADRVYIVQPHPLGNESLLSVYYEVKRKGVEPMKPHMQGLPISEVPKFSSDLVKNLFLYITDIDEQVNDNMRSPSFRVTDVGRPSSNGSTTTATTG